MITINELQNSTNHIFQSDLKPIKIPTNAQDHINALRDADCHDQALSLLYQERNKIALNLGFQPLSLTEAVGALTGKPPNLSFPKRRIHLLKYFFDHYQNLTASTASIEPIHFHHAPGKTAIGRFFSRWEYDCVLTCMSKLIQPIPYGVLLRIAEIKKLRLFNCFLVIAPKEAIQPDPPSNIDPIILATICKDNSQYQTITQSSTMSHYFLAQW